MKELIGKSNDGAFVLTPSGEQELYFITTRKLIQYYLKEGLQKDPVSIAEKMNNLSVFIYSNFQKIEDYLNKLPELANFIGEDNIQRFQKFMGQHFVNTLQKEKAILLKKEIETSKDKLDNPFWTPSSEFINKFGILFSSAPALVWPPVDSKNAAAPTIPEPAAALQNISDTTQIESTAPVAAAVKNKPAPQSPTLTEEPGVAFLKLFSRNFLSAKPLDPLINQEPQTDATTTESSGEDENIPAQPVNSLPVSPAATPKKEIIPILTEMPGETFLKKSGSIFVNSPKLEPDSTSRPMENKHASTAKLFSLKEFASILGNIAKFTRAKDNAGYQNWYSSLPYLSKA
ncbi:MAG: hypothetical protein OEV66_11580, partial [Spirochaetia bacterium]|nr:hypothetical protein [Spirochaetia bacterium]